MQTICVSQNLKTPRDYFFKMYKINLITFHRPKLLVIQPIPVWSEIRSSFCLYGGKREKGKIVLYNRAGRGEGGVRSPVANIASRVSVFLVLFLESY